ncbi:hypothetical protein GCM10018785_18440 [Streptomyces longispororuber]|uniref:Secreted protein n=1 Tax=Streptomyces longispororuber TaxID=68230 RepID=A0A919DJ04_9ACTN|nr:hypothetical protein [Streptomyces longispororuber]GHE49198.1 hypothetical protein GCM10018785_18440 [Streptomyces longispororuber]
MRAPSVRRTAARRITTTALCATLLLGVTGPVLALQAASRQDPPAAGAPVPEADKLLAQATALGGLGTVLTPVTDLVTQVLKAEGGTLEPEQAKKLGDAVREALDKLKTAEAAPPGTSPQPPAASPQPQATSSPPSATPPQPQASPPQPQATSPQPPAAPPQPQATLPTPDTLQRLSFLEETAYADRAIPRDIKDDTVKQLRRAVDALLKASASGDAAAVATSVKDVVAGAVNTVVAVLLTGKLPAPNLPGLPPLPKSAGHGKASADDGQGVVFSGSHESPGY